MNLTKPDHPLLAHLTTLTVNNQYLEDMINALSENTKTAYRKAIQTFLASGFAFPATPTDIATTFITAL